MKKFLKFSSLVAVLAFFLPIATYKLETRRDIPVSWEGLQIFFDVLARHFNSLVSNGLNALVILAFVSTIMTAVVLFSFQNLKVQRTKQLFVGFNALSIVILSIFMFIQPGRVKGDTIFGFSIVVAILLLNVGLCILPKKIREFFSVRAERVFDAIAKVFNRMPLAKRIYVIIAPIAAILLAGRLLTFKSPADLKGMSQFSYIFTYLFTPMFTVPFLLTAALVIIATILLFVLKFKIARVIWGITSLISAVCMLIATSAISTGAAINAAAATAVPKFADIMAADAKSILTIILLIAIPGILMDVIPKGLQTRYKEWPALRKFLAFSSIIAIIAFFVPFMQYSVRSAPKPTAFSFMEILFGKSFMIATPTGQQVLTSGFNIPALIAILATIAVAVVIWTVPKLNASKYIVTALSLVAIAGMTLCIAPFGRHSEFVETMALYEKGFKVETTLLYAVIISILAINAIVGLVTEKFAYNISRYKWFFIMFLPAIVFFVVFCYIPMVGLVLMFLNYNVADVSQSTWAGLKWFKVIISGIDGEFGQVLINTLVISATRLVVSFPCPIILALMFNECGNMAFKRIIQTVTYLPHFISWSIIGGLIISLFSSQFSFINGILRMINPENPQTFYLLNEVDYIRATMVVSTIWKSVGWSAIIYMAALSGISPELYESAKLDGAGKLAQIWYITLPGMANIITMNLIFSVSGLMGVDFEQAQNLVYPLTVAKGKVLSVYVFDVGVRNKGNFGMGGNYSYSTALGFIQSMLSLFLTIVANAVAKRVNEEGAIW